MLGQDDVSSPEQNSTKRLGRCIDRAGAVVAEVHFRSLLCSSNNRGRPTPGKERKIEYHNRCSKKEREREGASKEGSLTDDGFLDGAVNCGRIMVLKMEEEEASRPPIVVAFKNGGNFCQDQDDCLRSIMKMAKYTEHKTSLAKIAI